jgi:hypothetical protein
VLAIQAGRGAPGSGNRARPPSLPASAQWRVMRSDRGPKNTDSAAPGPVLDRRPIAAGFSAGRRRCRRGRYGRVADGRAGHRAVVRSASDFLGRSRGPASSVSLASVIGPPVRRRPTGTTRPGDVPGTNCHYDAVVLSARRMAQPAVSTDQFDALDARSRQMSTRTFDLSSPGQPGGTSVEWRRTGSELLVIGNWRG